MLFKRQNQENKKASHSLGENFTKHVSDKGLVARTYKELFQLKIIQTVQFNTGKRSEQIFHQRRHKDEREKMFITNHLENRN